MTLPALRSGSAMAPIVPTTMEDVWRIAQLLAASKMSPLDTPEKCAVAIMHGLEIGLPPMAAVQSIAVINGRPTLYGKAVAAVLYRAGFRLEESDDGETAVCTVIRPDGQRITRTFSNADAKKAGLLNKSGPWTQYPQRMRPARARGFAVADGAADVMTGMYLTEEMRDVQQGGELREDPPAARELEPVPELPPEPEMPPDVDEIADPDGFVEHFREQYMAAEGSALREEVLEANADVIERLPLKHKLLISAIKETLP